ncbi:hypothetical protein ACB094_01G254300 [Castanea mollissima]
MSGRKMCNKNSPDMKTRSMTKKEKARGRVRVRVREPLKPARKSRTKTRKPKFLSLRLELSSENSNTTSSTQMIKNDKTNSTHQQQQQQQQQQHQHQLNLFPLHPENLVEDKDLHDENVAFLFNSTESGGASLNFLGSSSEEDSLSPPTPSLTYPYGSEEVNNNGDCSNYSSSRSKLLRTAMRIKERDPSKEKWVCYSEVVEKKQKVELEEVSSCTRRTMTTTTTMMKTQGLLSLKLDYQGIMNAWSDKGPLYIEGESPQTVPVLHDEANVLVDGYGSVGNIWRVPEMGSSDDIGCRMKVKEEELELELKGKDGWKMRHREASVLRYKEKRQNRLFSKRIRYEVRKLNAEKRPRMKGRFVKRS